MGKEKIPLDKVPVKLDKFIRMEANSCTREEKLRVIFGIDMRTATARQINNADATMCRWRKHPLYDAIWKDEISRQDYSDIAESLQTIRKHMRQDKDGWLSMNSAVNLLSQSSKRVYRAEENTVNVQITGLPELGSPDDDG